MRTGVGGVVLISLLHAAQAHAQSPPPAGPVILDGEESARRHFLQGNALFGEGNFAGALAEFEASYRNRPVAAVLFNLAQAHRELFQYVEAVAAMERYLAEAGDKAPVEKRQEAEALLVEWRALIADIAVTTNVPDAQITVDGNVVSQRGAASVRVATGPHVIEVTAAGHSPEKRSITVAGRTMSRIDVPLKPLATSSHLHVDAEPAGALLVLDGKSQGFLPFDAEVPAGPHELSVSADGYETRQDAIALAVGERRTVQLALKHPASDSAWYKKWYFWTSVVAIVGGGIAIALIATQGPPDPYVGSLNPGVFPVGR